MQKPEGFRSFAELFREPIPVEAETTTDTSVECDITLRSDDSHSCAHDDESLRDIRLFHAHLRDLLSRALETLLERIASEVLERELSIAPAAIDAIVQRALTKIGEPLKLWVHAADAASLQSARVPVEIDASLEPGDVIFEFADGTVSSSIRSRLNDAMLRSLTDIA